MARSNSPNIDPVSEHSKPEKIKSDIIISI
jgi:hypothetical protein